MDKLIEEESSLIRESTRKLAEGLGFKLPFLFGGKFAAWLFKRNSFLGKITRFRNVIDNLLTLAEIFAEIIIREVDTRLTARWIKEPKKLREMLETTGGYALESIIRGFLREIVESPWKNCCHYMSGDLEIDVYAEGPITERLKEVHIGEVRKTLGRDDIGRLMKNISKLIGKPKDDKTSNNAKISNVALITLIPKNMIKVR